VSWWVVVNPTAGRGGRLRERADRALGAVAVEYQMVESTSAADVDRLVAEGVAAGSDRFVAVGGDGTAHLVLNAMLRHAWEDPPGLAILPAGSGSDFIRTFGLPRDFDHAAGRLASGEWYATDVMLIEGDLGRVFALNVVEAGVGAASVGTASRLPRWLGGVRYAVAFWLTLPWFRPATITVSDDRGTSTSVAIAALVANGQFFGGGMNVAPRSAAGDGLLDVQIFAGPRRKAFSVMPRVVRGSHLSHRSVQRSTAGHVTLAVPAHWPIEADGDVIGSGPITVRALHHAIQFRI